MKACTKRLIGLIFVLLSAATGFSQTADSSVAARQFIKSNLRFLYTPEPNADAISLHWLDNDSLSNNTNGIIFGRLGNNGMNISAGLILSLFRPQANGGDTALQLLTMRIVRATGKKAIVIFINDTRAGLNQAAITNLHPYRVSINGNQYVYPGSFPVGANMPGRENYIGNIVFGEKVLSMNSITSAKVDFINLLTRTSLSNYDAEAWSSVFRLSADASQPMYSFLVEDQRIAPLQGIANCFFSSLYNNEQRRLDTLVETCFNRGLVYWREADSRRVATRTISGTETVPSEFWLRNCLIRESMDPLTRELPAGTAEVFRSNYRSVCIRDLPPQYLLRNEHAVSVICSRFLNQYGSLRMINAIYKGVNDLKTIRGDRLPMAILENLCNDLVGTSSAPVHLTGRQLMPLAIADFLCRWQLTGSTNQYAQNNSSPVMRAWISAYNTSVKAQAQAAITALPSSASLTQQVNAIVTRLNSL